MNRLQEQLAAFEAVLLAPASGATMLPTAGPQVSAFIRGIERRIRFIEYHTSVLAGIHWDRVERIGRRPSGPAPPSYLNINLPDASLTIKHTDAVIDHVYMAFDGLTAAVVNMTDSMGRLINVRYALGITPKKASLLSLKDPSYCTSTSPIGVVVNDPRHNDWLKSVRDLRGRCQHADVEEAVVAAEGRPYSRRGQPVIPLDYHWQTPPKALPIVEYAQDAVLAAEETLLAVVGAVVSAPTNPLR